MPTTAPDIVITPAGTAVTFAVLANDSGPGLLIDGYTLPASGSLTLNPDQSFTYTPAGGFTGIDGFTYTVRDAEGATAVGQVTITVLAPNDPPLPADDEATAMAGAVTIDVLANDSDPDGDAVELVALGTPAYGSVTVNPDRSLTYWPQEGFQGTDRFSYTIADQRGASAAAMVTVRVERSNAPPVGGTLPLVTTVDTPVVFDPRAAVEDPDGDPLQLEGVGLPAAGRLVVNGDGTLTYLPDAGFVGEDGFTCTLGDGRGGRATVMVTVAVEQPNSAPTAGDDAVATPFETPVTLDPLANDGDPDGDPLELESLGFPAHGRLAINGDGTLTYTPDAGFSGEDAFTYTVTDGRGERASAEVRITVAPPPPQTYANGYAYRRRLLVPAQGSGETVTGFVLLVDQQGDWLRSVANGGLVESGQGFDLRFELEDGTKLAHEIDAYDPVAGRLLAWVRIPSWDQARALHLFLYYGKTDLATTEANPTAVWQDYLAVWDTASGRDRTAGGRHLTPTGLGSGALVGAAGLFDGNGDARLGDGSFLNGLPALCVQAVVRADPAIIGSRDARILLQGDPAASPGQLGLDLFYDVGGYFGGASRTVKFALMTTDGSVQIEGPSGTQSADRQVLSAVWQAGGPPRLYVDGAEVAASWTGLAGQQGAVAGGTTSMVAGQPLSVGLGALNSARSWIGLIDEVRIAAAVPPAGRLAAEARNLLDPAAFYGIGDDERFTDYAESPVAVPLAAVTTPGQWVEVDPLAISYLPAGTELALDAQPQSGIASLVDGRIRYTPFAGFTGRDGFTYSLVSGTKTARARIDITVAVDPAAGEYPPPLRTVEVATASELSAALASAQPGDHIVLADGDYGGATFATAVAGTSASPVVIRASSKLGARLTSQLTVRHPWYILWGLDFDDAALGVEANASDLVVRRCRSRNYGAYQGIWCRVKAPRVRFEKCDLSSSASRGIALDLAAGGTALTVSRCHFHDWGPGNTSDQTFEPLQMGFGAADSDRDAAARIEYCLFENINGGNGEPETVSIKSRNVTVYGCHLRNARMIKVRIGRQAHIEACTIENLASGMPAAGIEMAGPDNRVLGCAISGSGARVRLFAGTVDGDSDPSGWANSDYPSANRNRLVGVTAPSFAIGYQYHSGMNRPVRDARLENVTGNVSLLTEAGTVQTATESEAYDPPVTLTAADVGPDAP